MSKTDTFHKSATFAKEQAIMHAQELQQWAKRLEESYKEGYRDDVIDHELSVIRDHLNGFEWARGYEGQNIECIKQLVEQ